MTDYHSGNFAFTDPPFQDGDVVHSCNCIQALPGTEICVGVPNVTVLGGNFVNCIAPPTWDKQGGNWGQMSFCSHLHPNRVEHGLPECEEECEHLVDTDTITIDGQEIVVERHYQDKRV